MSPSKFNSVILILFTVYSLFATAQNEQPLSGKGFVTQDTLFKEPYVDMDVWRNTPVRHRYVHGGFKGTNTRFSFYFPSREKYQSHFFQYITPFPDDENLSQGASGE